jgi:hypothetical protein
VGLIERRLNPVCEPGIPSVGADDDLPAFFGATTSPGVSPGDAADLLSIPKDALHKVALPELGPCGNGRFHKDVIEDLAPWRA